MNKKAVTKNVALVFFLVFLVSLVSCGVFVFADHIILPSNFSVNESASTLYNISVNNTGATTNLNITSVKFTLPSNFTFVISTNGTDAGAHTFSNTSNVLNWSNDGLVMNNTLKYFWFNASVSFFGTYNISVDTFNSTGWSWRSNLTVIVNDTTIYSTNSTNSTYAGQSVLHNLYWRDNVGLSGYIFSFNNGNGTLYNDSWVSMAGTSNWSNVSKTVNSTIGSNIQWKVYANDSAGNWNGSSTYVYTTTDGTAPTVTLNSPDNSAYSSSTSVTFNCSATDNYNLSNITLYGNWSGGWHANETVNKNGTSNSTTFSKTLVTNSRFLWACYACDNANNCAFATSNYTLTIDTSNPTVTLVSPDNEDVLTDDSVAFKYTPTDNFGISNCSLYVKDLLSGSVDSSIDNGDEETFTRTLAEDDYTWRVGCCDYIGHCVNSSEGNFIVDLGSDSGSGSGGSNDDEETITPVVAKTTDAGNLTNLGVSKSIVNMAAGDKVIFLFQNTNHTLTMKNISTGAVTENITFLELTSTPIIFSLINNEAKTFDLDGNGRYDFSINATKVTGSRISLLMKAINGSEVILGIGVGQTENATGNQTAAKKIEFQIAPESWKWIALAMAVIAVGFAVATGIAVQRKKRRGEFKHHWKKR